MHRSGLSYEDILLFMENAPANIFFKNTECKYCFVTEVCQVLNGGKENSIIGKTDLQIHTDPIAGRMYYEDDLKILATGEGSEYISKYSTPDGIGYYEIKKNPVICDGKIIGIIGIVINVTEKFLLEEKLKELSYKDQLTGLYNRNYMEMKKKSYALNDTFPISLIMADCNYLKKINDSLGHEYGDMLLKRMAVLIKEKLPEDCTAIRIGGDEFLLICPNFSAMQAEELIAKLQQACKHKSDSIMNLDAAFGYYTCVDKTVSFEDALSRADQNMYENKRKSRENI